jgi:hypothetical protein
VNYFEQQVLRHPSPVGLEELEHGEQLQVGVKDGGGREGDVSQLHKYCNGEE